jgi:putative Holliday junction resolvase
VPVLALDLGSRRIGIAVSDETDRIALPHGTLARRGLRRDLESVAALIRERRVEEIVVGLPVHMNGSEGSEARDARTFADALAKASGLPVECLDERWSSREAERALRDVSPRGGRTRRRAARERGDVDAAAASLILSTYLARRGERGAAVDGTDH